MNEEKKGTGMVTYVKRVIVFAVVLFCVIYGYSSHAATGNAEKNELEKIREDIVLKVDEVENLTWINTKDIEKIISKNELLYIYLGENEKQIWVRFVIGFKRASTAFLFFDNIIFNVDGERSEISTKTIKGRKEILRNMNILELVDIEGENHLPLLSRIADSKKTIIRFTASRLGDGKHDFEVSNEQKTALRKLIRYYELIKKEK